MCAARPHYPADEDWVERLHWTVCAMDTDDRDLGFVASRMVFAFKDGDLSEPQQRFAFKVIDRVRPEFAARSL